MTSCDFVCKPNIPCGHGVTFIFIFVNEFAKECNPADTQSRFNVDTTSYDITQRRTTSYEVVLALKRRRINVETTSRVHGEEECVAKRYIDDKTFHIHYFMIFHFMERPGTILMRLWKNLEFFHLWHPQNWTISRNLAPSKHQTFSVETLLHTIFI